MWYRIPVYLFVEIGCVQEELMNMSLHTIQATCHRASSTAICSPETDVFVLAAQCFLCKDTKFVIETQENRISLSK